MPSFNKRGYAVEAVRSVLDQDFADWELWIMENSTDNKTRRLLDKFVIRSDPRIIYEEIDISPQTRARVWPAPYLLNQYYPLANGEIILYISDDDLFMPGLFQRVSDYFYRNPKHDALYFHMVRTRAPQPGTGKDWDEQFQGIAADIPRGPGALDCQIDGGQIAYRKHVLEAAGQPYFYEGKGGDASHCDGLHMEHVAKNANVIFYPLAVPGVIHRHTLLSTWTN